VTKTQSFTGIIAGTSVADYQNNIIKKHEDIIALECDYSKRYEIFKVQYRTGLMTYPDNKTIENWILTAQIS
jgi:uncharacterized protein (DUF1015 family)